MAKKDPRLKLDLIERNTLELLCQGLTMIEASKTLGVTPTTVRVWVRLARARLDCKTTYQLIAKYCGYESE